MNKLVFVGLLVLSTSANAQLYKCTKDGKTTLGDQPCPKGSVDLNPQKLTVPPPPKPATAVGPKKMTTYACSYGESFKPCLPDNPVTEAVKKNAIAMCTKDIKSWLKDPDSAKVISATRGDPNTMGGKVVRQYLFEINAKNSFGGYSGAQLYGCLVNSEENKVLYFGTMSQVAGQTDPIPNF